MTDRYFDTVISLTDARQSALFYEHVIPLQPWDVILTLVELKKRKADLDKIEQQMRGRFKQKFRELAPDYLRDNREYLRGIAHINAEIWRCLPKKSDDEREAMIERLVTEMNDFLKKFDLSRLPYDTSEEMISEKCASETQVCISFLSKSIIEVDSVDWKQIIEFRRDKGAKEKLRRFRLFANANYLGKPKAYVEDDILRRLDEYETIVKQWGFETAEGALNMLVSSKALAGTGAGALISTLFGAPVTAVLAGAVGAAVELSRVAIYVGKQHFILRKMLNENPVSYISYAKKELGSAEC